MIETLERRVVYENDYVTVWDDRVRFPDGHSGTYFRTRWKAPHGVSIVPLLGEDVLLIRIFRYQEQAYSFEIPQGFGVEGSDAHDDALRELREETGLEGGALEHLFDLGADYVTRVFLARLPGDAVPCLAGQESTESIGSFLRVPVGSISLEFIRDHAIHDPATVAALLAVRSLMPR